MNIRLDKAMHDDHLNIKDDAEPVRPLRTGKHHDIVLGIEEGKDRNKSNESGNNTSTEP